MKRFLLILPLVGLMTACNFLRIDPITNPNAPELNQFINNPTPEQINQLAIGTFSGMRNGYAGTSYANGTSSYDAYCRIAGTLGREVYWLNTSETRWASDLAGTNGALDNASFYDDYYFAFSNARKTAEIFQQSALTSKTLTDAQKAGIQGFTNTVMAFEMLHILNMQGDNGIRLNVTDYLNPGPFGTYGQSLTALRTLLDQGLAQLQKAGDTFAFPVPSGFAGFDTPATFAGFNRAVAARIATYQKDWPGALTALRASYLDLTGNLALGPYFTWSTAPDVLNPSYQTLNNNNPLVANPSFVTDAEPGDARLAKVARRQQPYTLLGITAAYDVNLYPTNTTPTSIIRNEELVLLYAEAQLQLGNLPEALKAINVVRTQSGKLPPYSGPVAQPALLDELLKQRRYSLFFAGHRWVDMRRYGRLNQLPLDAPGQTVFDRMPRPFAEVSWGQ